MVFFIYLVALYVVDEFLGFAYDEKLVDLSDDKNCSFWQKAPHTC
jgi:hypothetical protein